MIKRFFQKIADKIIIKTKSINNYKLLENIRYYCLNITDNECERRLCVDKIIF